MITWTTKEGKEIPVGELNPHHRANICRGIIQDIPESAKEQIKLIEKYIARQEVWEDFLYMSDEDCGRFWS